MSFLLTLGHVVALTLLVYLWTYAVFHRGRPGSRSLLWLFSLLIEWAAAAFGEYLAPPESKIIFRNLAQIGVMGAPAMLWAFSTSYTRRTAVAARWEQVVAWVLVLCGIVGFALYITDGWHHWLRRSVEFVAGAAGTEMVVRPTHLGEAFTSMVFVTGAASFVRLLVFAFRDGRSQFWSFALFLAAIFVPTVYAIFLQATVGESGFRLPMPLTFAFSALLLSFGAYRLDFLGVTPIARNIVFDVLEEGIIVCSSDGRVLDLNAAARQLLLSGGDRFSDAENVLDSAFPERRTPSFADETRRTEFSLSGPNGVRVLQLMSYPVARRSAVLGCVSVVRDITQLRQQNDILVDRAERDGLTSLLNRATFVDRVERALAQEPELPALIVFDIDEFKGINDRIGHLGGDRTLLHVVSRVGTSLRETDVFGRLGGDEFAVFLTGLDSDLLAALAERIRASVAESKLKFEGRTVDVAISVGFAMGPRSFEQLYHRADQALYEAKRQGRNLVRGYLA